MSARNIFHTRHPMSEQDLVQTLARWTPGRVQEALDELEASGRAQVVARYGVRFWSAAPSYYPAEAQSQAVDPRKHQADGHARELRRVLKGL